MNRVQFIHWNAAEAQQEAVQLRASGFDVDFEPVTPDSLRGLKENPPAAVVIDLSRLPIDSGDLLRLDSNGSLTKVARGLAERSVTRFQVNEPHRVMGLWLDPGGNVYVAVYGAGLVKRVSPEGEVSVIARSRFPWSPTGGLVAPNGDQWLLEYSLTNAVRVRRLGRGGKERIY